MIKYIGLTLFLEGVPKDSVLGPLLFLIYMNYINNAVPGNDVKLFADDTNVFIYGSNLALIECEANKCLKNLESWFNSNKLSLNVEKTCCAIFNSCNTSSDVTLNLNINNQKISKVSNCKYLGVFIDDAFKWNFHIDYIYKKVIRFVSFFIN